MTSGTDSWSLLCTKYGMCQKLYRQSPLPHYQSIPRSSTLGLHSFPPISCTKLAKSMMRNLRMIQQHTKQDWLSLLYQITNSLASWHCLTNAGSRTLTINNATLSRICATMRLNFRISSRLQLKDIIIMFLQDMANISTIMFLIMKIWWENKINFPLMNKDLHCQTTPQLTTIWHMKGILGNGI